MRRDAVVKLGVTARAGTYATVCDRECPFPTENLIELNGTMGGGADRKPNKSQENAQRRCLRVWSRALHLARTDTVVMATIAITKRSASRFFLFTPPPLMFCFKFEFATQRGERCRFDNTPEDWSNPCLWRTDEAGISHFRQNSSIC